MKALLFVLLPCVAMCSISVEVYYSGSSEDSVKFIKEQLVPTYMELNFKTHSNDSKSDRLKVKLIPYGTSFTQQFINGSDVLKCVGVPMGCYVDKVHACAINQFQDEWKALGFANCFTKMPSKYPSQCASQACTTDRWMFQCVNTVDGDQLLIEHGKTTQKLNMTLTAESLPVVTFGGRYNVEEQQQAKENLLSLVCRKMDDPPPMCRSAPRALRTMTHNNFGTNKYYHMYPYCKK